MHTETLSAKRFVAVTFFFFFFSTIASKSQVVPQFSNWIGTGKAQNDRAVSFSHSGWFKRRDGRWVQSGSGL